MPTITLLITLCFSFLVPFSFLSFLFSLLSFTHFLTSFSLVFISLVLCSPLFSLLCTAKTLFILPTVTDFLLFYPLTAFVLVSGIGALSTPFTSLSTVQPSPFTYASHATSHSHKKEFYFVFLLTVAFPFK